MDHRRAQRCNADALPRPNGHTPACRDSACDHHELRRLVFDQNPLPMWVYDAETLAFLRVNAAAIARYGHSESEFLRLRITDICPPEDIPTVLEQVAGQGREYQTTGPWRHMDKCGRMLDVETTTHALEYAGRPAALVMTKDVTEALHAERARETRLCYDATLAACMRLLFMEAPTEQTLPQVLEHLRVASGTGRAYVFENYLDPHKELCCRLRYETCAEGVPALLGREGLQQVIWTETYERWRSHLSANEPLAAVVSDLPEAERRMLVGQDIQSMLLLPIWVDGHWHGVIGFDDLEQPRAWSPDDVHLLHTAAHMMGSFMERRQAYETLGANEARFRAMVENTSDTMSILAMDSTVLYEGPSTQRILGYAPEELVGQSGFQHLHPEDAWMVIESFRESVCRPGEEVSAEFRLRHKDGRWVFMEGIARNLADDPSIGGIVINCRDVSNRKRADETLRESERLFRAVFENASIGLYRTSPEGRILLANPALVRMMGYTSFEEMAARSLTGQGGFYPPDTPREHFLDLLERHGEVRGLDAGFIRADGSRIWVRENARAVYDADDNLLYYEGTLEDITERKVLEQKLAHQAFHDPLTNLPNRALFLDRLEHALARASRCEGTLAVVFLDLDNFKVINDTLGHEVGDMLLVDVADRLRECLRVSDTIARLGGDEFTVLLEDVGDVDSAGQAAERLRRVLKSPFHLGGREVFVSASLGIAFNVGGSIGSSDLLRNADAAMYDAKTQGKGRACMFDPGMNARAWERLELESDLRRAVARQEFRLVYQPKVCLRSGQVTTVEALIRWDHPDRGIVGPADFIPLAEETGLIVPMGQWVLEEACRQTQIWQAEGLDLVVSVNLSARQLQQADIVDQVSNALWCAGLEPGQLVLEITESAVVENARSAIATLQKLRALGVSLAIDDFGTGYSSLSHLRCFPVDMLKIDRSFVHDLQEGSDDAVFVSAMVSLGHALGLTVVAEGVETAHQASYLRALGCDLGQGYHFATPQDPRSIPALCGGARPAAACPA